SMLHDEAGIERRCGVFELAQPENPQSQRAAFTVGLPSGAFSPRASMIRTQNGTALAAAPPMSLVICRNAAAGTRLAPSTQVTPIAGTIRASAAAVTVTPRALACAASRSIGS